jgi:hypothetical protein
MITTKEDFLNDLIEIRESLNLSLNNISVTTRINIEYLEAIEEGRFEDLPIGYEKIFIKSYLKQLKAYNETRDTWVNNYFTIGIRSDDVDEQKKNFPKIDLAKFKLLVLWLPVISILMILVYIVYVNLGNKNDVSEIKEMPFEDQIAAIDTASVDSSYINEKIASIDSLALEIQISGPVFIVILIDSAERKQFSFNSKTNLKIKARNQFNIYANRGNNVSFMLDGNLIGKVAGLNQKISYLIIEKDGIVARGIVNNPADTIRTLKVGN